MLAEVVAMLGIERGAIVDHAWAVNGPEWAIVMLDSADRVLALDPVARIPIDLGVVGLHGSPEVRGFVVEDGPCWEDPVTGSLNAGLAQWLLGSGRLTAPYVARQGTALGRSGRVHVDRDPDGTVWIGGQTRTVVGGTAPAGRSRSGARSSRARGLLHSGTEFVGRSLHRQIETDVFIASRGERRSRPMAGAATDVFITAAAPLRPRSQRRPFAA